MSELNSAEEASLIEGLQAIDRGASVESVLASRAASDALRLHLDLRARLLAAANVEPSPQGFTAGREALLQRLTATPAPVTGPRAGTGAFFGGWLRSPLARAVLVGAALVALAGGALGASAAAGVDRAQDVLSALHIVSSTSQSGEQPHKGTDEALPTTDSLGGDADDDVPGGLPDGEDAGDVADDDADDDAGGTDDGVDEPLPDELDEFGDEDEPGLPPNAGDPDVDDDGAEEAEPESEE